MASPTPKDTQKFEAVYISPQGSHNFAYPLPASSATMSTEEKTAYLSTLRSTVVLMQDDINHVLTKKMEEDKASEADGAKNAKAKVVDEGKEEENYGEEVIDED
ncbi:MAG: hypothetical protein M1824_006432 [Vezdaea acicularis]|nr:MAG: hypothetical protein M1824_006432 [Vezdaea acicularis]